jgi:hypothetical protein
VVPEGPAGDKNYTHTIRAFIMDQLASTTIYDFEVQVLPIAEDVSVNDALDQMADVAANAAASGDPNSFAQALLTTTALLNKDQGSDDTDGVEPASEEEQDAVRQAKAEITSGLLKSMESMVDNSYATTTDSVQQQAQLTKEVCSDPDAMSEEDKLKCAQIAQDAASKALSGGVELNDETASAVLGTFTSVMMSTTTTNTTTNTTTTGDSATTSNAEEMANGFKDTVGDITQGLLVGVVPGEDSKKLDMEGLSLEVAVLSSDDLANVAIGGGTVQLNDEVAALMADLAGVGSTLLITEDNMYAFAPEPNSSVAVGGITSFSLADQSTGGEVAVNALDSPLEIVLNHDPIENWSNGTITGTVSGCWFWDEKDGGWSSDGCVVNYFDTAYSLSSPTQTVCLCTHLTDFNAKVGPVEISVTVNTISTEDVLNFTWENLVRGIPYTLITTAPIA